VPIFSAIWIQMSWLWVMMYWQFAVIKIIAVRKQRLAIYIVN